MYTQSFDVPDNPGAKPAPSASAGEDPARQAAFDARIDADGRIEPQDWMPEAYRKTLVRQIRARAQRDRRHAARGELDFPRAVAEA